MSNSQEPLSIALLVLKAIHSGQVNTGNVGEVIGHAIRMLEQTRTDVDNLKDSTIAALQEALASMKRVCEPAPIAPTHAEKSLLEMTTELAKRLESLDVRMASMERQNSETERLTMRHMKEINDGIDRVALTVSGCDQIAPSLTKELSQCLNIICAHAEFTIRQFNSLDADSKDTVKLLAEIRDNVTCTGTELARRGTQLDVERANVSTLMDTKLEEIQTKLGNIETTHKAKSVHEGEDSEGSAAASNAQSNNLMTTLDSLTQRFDGMKTVCERQSNGIHKMTMKSTEASEALRKITERVANLSKDCNDVITERKNSKFVPSSSVTTAPREGDSCNTVQHPLQKSDARQSLSHVADKSGSKDFSNQTKHPKSNGSKNARSNL